MARSVASLTATFGIAAGTLIVVGAILAGPAIVDCSRTPDGFAACLGDRMPAWLPAADNGADVPSPSATQTAEPGWIDANAGEYELPLSQPIELTPAGPALEISDPAPSAPAVPAVVAELIPPSLDVSAVAVLPQAPGELRATDLGASAATEGTLAVAVAEPPPSLPAPIELADPGPVPGLAVARSWGPPPEMVAALEPAPAAGTMAVVGHEPPLAPLPSALIPAPEPGLVGAPMATSPTAAHVALLTPPGGASVVGLPALPAISDSLVLLPSSGTVAAGAAKAPAAYSSIADLAPDTLIAPLAVVPAPSGPGSAVTNLEAGVGSDTLVIGGIGGTAAAVATVTLSAPLPVAPDPVPPASAMQFPDVVMLVPPAEGGNSSFVTLTLN